MGQEGATLVEELAHPDNGADTLVEDALMPDQGWMLPEDAAAAEDGPLAPLRADAADVPPSVDAVHDDEGVTAAEVASVADVDACAAALDG